MRQAFDTIDGAVCRCRSRRQLIRGVPADRWMHPPTRQTRCAAAACGRAQWPRMHAPTAKVLCRSTRCEQANDWSHTSQKQIKETTDRERKRNKQLEGRRSCAHGAGPALNESSQVDRHAHAPSGSVRCNGTNAGLSVTFQLIAATHNGSAAIRQSSFSRGNKLLLPFKLNGLLDQLPCATANKLAKSGQNRLSNLSPRTPGSAGGILIQCAI